MRHSKKNEQERSQNQTEEVEQIVTISLVYCGQALQFVGRDTSIASGRFWERLRAAHLEHFIWQCILFISDQLSKQVSLRGSLRHRDLSQLQRAACHMWRSGQLRLVHT